jgi:hypothetical protein
MMRFHFDQSCSKSDQFGSGGAQEMPIGQRPGIAAAVTDLSGN